MVDPLALSYIAPTAFEKPSAGRLQLPQRLVDVMAELMKFTYLTREVSDYLTSHYSEHKQKEDAEKLAQAKAVGLRVRD